MNVSFRKTHSHVCYQCEKQFDWENGVSMRIGKMEYKTIQERDRIEKDFCSEKCLNQYVTENNVELN